MGCAVSTDRLLAKFVSQAEPFEGSDYDTIDLTPAQGRKGAGMAWAELGEPLLDAGETANESVISGGGFGSDEIENLDDALSDEDNGRADEDPSDGTVIGRGLDEVLSITHLDVSETYHWDGRSTAISGSGLTLALDGPTGDFQIAFIAPLMNEFDARLVSMVVFDQTTGQRIVARGVDALTFSDGTRVAIPEGDQLAGHVGALRMIVDGQFANTFETYNDALVTFEQRGEIVSLPFFAVDIGTGRVHDYAGVATVRGSDGAEILTDTAGNDTVVGGAGNDVLTTTTTDEFGYDIVYGGAGNDRIIFGSGSASGFGGQGDDIFYAGAGTFGAIGQQGYDKLILDVDPADLIFQYMQGYANDLYWIGFTDGRSLGNINTIDEVVFGNKVWRVSEDDHADIGGYYKLVETAGGLKLSMLASFEDAEGNPTLIWDATSAEVVVATDGDDLIQTAAGDDHITLAKGYDTVQAGAGDDFIFASSNDADAMNVVYGMEGNDTVDLTNYMGAHTFFGGDGGRDTLLVSGRPHDYAVEQSSQGRDDDVGIIAATHDMTLTKTGADGMLRTITASNVEQVIFSDGTTWERAGDSAELFPLT